MIPKRAMRNYWLMVAEGALWQGHLTLLDPAAVVALFLSAMTGQTAMAGLAMAVMQVAPMLGKIGLGPLTPRIRRLVRYQALMKAARSLTILGLAVPLLLGASSAVSVGVFFVLYTAFNLLDGAGEVPVGELRARVLPPELRGHMTGVSLFAGGGVSLAASFALSFLLTAPGLGDKTRFALVFLAAGGCLALGLIPASLIRDDSAKPGAQPRPLPHFFRGLPGILRSDPALRALLAAMFPGFFSEIVVNFLMVFSANALHLPQRQVSFLIMARVAGIIMGGLVWGEISRRRGNRAVIIGSQGLCGLVALCALAAERLPRLGFPWMLGVCLICGVAAPGWLGRVNYLLDIAPAHLRSEYQVLVSVMTIPFGFSGLFAGLLVDRLGYGALFCACAGFSVITVGLARRLMRRADMEGLLRSLNDSE